jgi:hypothetical protein
VYLDTNIYMMTNVNTILICLKCTRNVAMSSTNTWSNRVMGRHESDCWTYITIVYCSSCMYAGMDAYAGMKLPMHKSSIPDAIYDSIKSMPKIMTMNMSVHTVDDTDGEMHPGTKMSTCMDNLYIKVENVYAVMSKMTDAYTIVSVHEGRVITAHPNFIMSGPAYEMTRRAVPMYKPVNNVLICPLCWRNYILTGMYTITDLNDRTIRYTHMNLIMYTCCNECKFTKKLSHKDAFVSLDMNGPKSAHMVAYVSKHLGTDVYIYNNKKDYEGKIVNLDLVTQRLGFVCKRWSMINGQEENAYRGFV